MIIHLLKTDGDSHEFLMLAGKSEYVMGREEGDLVLGDERCSRRHAALFVDEQGRVGIRDLGSTNGVIVNKKKVAEALLTPEDTFRLGRTIFIFFGCQEDGSPNSQTALVKRQPVDWNDAARSSAPKPVAAPSRPKPVPQPAAKATPQAPTPKSSGPLPEVMSSAIEWEALQNLPDPQPLGSVLLNQWPDNFRALRNEALFNFIDHMDADQKQKSRRLVEISQEPNNKRNAA